MIDIISATFHAEAQAQPSAIAFGFAAGAVTSFGPCVAPRLIAVASLTAKRSFFESSAIGVTYIAGLCTAYAAWAVAASLLWKAFAFSMVTYLLLAAGLFGAGVWTLLRPGSCTQHAHNLPRRHLAAVFLLGASMALTLSPCCTPLILGAATYGATTGMVWAVFVLVAFALGHAVPIVATMLCGNTFARVLVTVNARDAARTVSASLLMGIGAYYAVLA